MTTATRTGVRSRAAIRKCEDQRENVRAAINQYIADLETALITTEQLHAVRGGLQPKLYDIRASLVQVRSAKRVLWMED